ncbi:MAG: methyltransferase domain-containing protein [Proteobacteria bacterium]|nr:methyltransferase domain-containing protein [Pseudomonadota bacterium]
MPRIQIRFTMAFKHIKDEECERINRLQADYFSRVKQVFDPPYPEGVPERLEIIVKAAEIKTSDTVVDIGSGTGVLIPLIQGFNPEMIYANDLSKSMLSSVKERYQGVLTILGGIRNLALPDHSVDVFLINACYPNLVDKDRSFKNIARMLKPWGRVIISHPMGRSFTDFLKREMPFPVDDFPVSLPEAGNLFKPYGFRVRTLIDHENLYLLILEWG